jgi:hypothetical protein
MSAGGGLSGDWAGVGVTLDDSPWPIVQATLDRSIPTHSLAALSAFACPIKIIAKMTRTFRVLV